ncbi:hypothetical protein EI42_05541 [Thermosporothrix hazakensis]|jgi:hypothetical protein|uniref:Uncharacterized protein n=1 Tax=Thermosporothrix hazakensis TaxID=644383 RepID=A0A326TZP5_THEHA|nr:hypothetical protein [Thermosporothrix hazakensis]PZW22407.1 hypothetical protein EI42_05541 [Thermosporothrix hazakensis]GCE49161.1 hypothetical protein KTH_40300 [Thermosporothrix hazakensis]
MYKKLVSLLLKEQLCAFLGVSARKGIYKAELVERVCQLVESDPQEMQRLLAMFPIELAVVPGELEELLHCTATERKRWTREGKLPVLEYREVRISGRMRRFAVHDRREILAITAETVARWREEHAVLIQQRRSAGARSAANRKTERQQVREQFWISWEQMRAEWEDAAGAQGAAVLRLAYWTVWASRWAKFYHVKHLRGRKHAQRYAELRDRWYALKQQAMLALWRTPYALLSFYRPPSPDREHFWLCQKHYEEKCEEEYESVYDFFRFNQARIETCPACQIERVKDYYSLYLLEIMIEAVPEARFAFHLPYPLGRSSLPAPKVLPAVIHVEQEGLFRFGRPLTIDEQSVYREQDVLASLEQALHEVQALFA